jgi:hypothetical protein
MRTDSGALLPKARSEGIITKEVDGELLIYDRARDQAHCLNETAAAVWKRCDGQSSVQEIGQHLARRRGQTVAGSKRKAESSVSTPSAHHRVTNHYVSADTQLVWLALDQLRRLHLLEEGTAAEDITWPASIPGLANMSRREAVRRIGLAAAIALPLVVAITAPTATEAAASCKHHCETCSSPIECCGTCSTNVPGCSGSPRCT